MAESHWLSERAHRLQHICLDPETGTVVDQKMFSLYLRYQTTHTRAFHKCLNGLLKLRAEERKAAGGFEAQKIQQEKHEMKKQAHQFELFKKDVSAHLELCEYITQMLQARRENPQFGQEFAAELTKRGMPVGKRESAFISAA